MSVVLETAQTLDNIIKQIPGAKVEHLKSGKTDVALFEVTDKNNSVFRIEVRTQ